ncbi:RNA polymerase sigma factor [Streptomyces sp. NPDC048420]|uniref:RNA polymerase sigma factor n=1 Tax=Streptomyces sp. NPDC048420 TaxID=3155755 RepID=UPI00344A1188
MTTDMRTRMRAGDPDAFAELYDECARSVYNHAFRLTADWSVAEDVMSATFMEAWRRRDSIEAEGGSLRPWLLGIATNVSRSHGRGNRRYRAAVSAVAGAGVVEVADHAEEIAGRVDDRRRIVATLTALASLRRPEREVRSAGGRPADDLLRPRQHRCGAAGGRRVPRRGRRGAPRGAPDIVALWFLTDIRYVSVI